jgi:pyruvate,water dikinase
VLVAPYFDNAWVTQIDKFKGIVLEQGGTLSHSAIVAREKNIPYRIHWEGATTEFKTGDFINE